MKSIPDVEKKSLLSKIKDSLKHSILADIFVNENAGRVFDEDDLESEAGVTALAHEANVTTDEILNYKKAFEEANEHLSERESSVSKIPEIKKESINPFHVNESDLSHDEDTQSRTKSKEDGKERDDL